MDKKCSLCGNIYKNRIFRGGYICADCTDYIRNIEISPIVFKENIRIFTRNKKRLGQ